MTTTETGELILDDAATAASFATALLSMREWIHRRVDAVTFTDADTVQRRTSLDFTVVTFVPQVTFGEVTTTLVPLTYLAKSPISTLDVHDEGGAAVSVLTTQQNGRLTAAALRSLVLAMLDPPDHDELELDIGEIDDLLRTITMTSPQRARAAFDDLTRVLERHRHGVPDPSVAGIVDLLDVIETAVDNFVLIAACDARIGQRRILKFSYVEPIRGGLDERRRRERILDAFGFTPHTFVFAIPGANVAASFHIEITCPAGVGITEAVLYGTTSGEVVVGPAVREGRPTVHLLAPHDPGAACQVKVNLRPTPGGWLRSSVAVVSAVAAVLTLSAIRLDVVTGPSRPAGSPPPGDIAALLLAFVGVVAALVIRSGEHALTARLLSAARGATMVAVALPFVGAWLLAFGPAGTALTVLWWLLATCGWLVAATLMRMYRGPGLVGSPPVPPGASIP